MQEYTTSTAQSQAEGLPPLPESDDVREWARFYVSLGWRVVPLARGLSDGKRPKPTLGTGWNRPERLDEIADGVEMFFARGDNIGLTLGVRGSKLLDIDLDDPHALQLAPHFLPTTGLRFGRASTPRSHWLYACDEPCASLKFVDPDGRELVGLRADGTDGAVQSMCPPSYHEGAGEQVRWDDWGVPSHIPHDELREACRRLAAAALLARVWHDGARHHLSLALAGALVRAGWAQDAIESFIESLCRGVGDEEWRDRVRAVRDSYERILAEREAWGYPKLAELVGDERLAAKIAEYLRIPRRGETTPAVASPATRETRAASGLLLARAVLRDAAELAITDDHRPLVTLQRGERFETYLVGGELFRAVLLSYCGHYGIAPRDSVLAEAESVIMGRCWNSGRVRTPSLRVGGDSTRRELYLDLCRPDWQMVRITPDGWQTVAYSPELPARFVRSRAMQPLPIPERGGEVHRLREFVRLNDDDWLLLLAYLLACYRTDAPYPVLVIRGAQGAGKSTLTRIVRALVDPRVAAQSSAPPSERDLLVAASNTHLLCYDNLSRLDEWLSDALCRLATGGGFETRTLYTDSDVTVIAARRPVVLNSIRDVLGKPDLLDRAVLVELTPPSEQERLPETTFWSRWQAVYPQVLGALLDGVARALRDYDAVQLPRTPRMADFAHWAAAGLQAYGYDPLAFLHAYERNRADALATLGEGDALVELIERLLTTRDAWSGTATQLLDALCAIDEELAQRIPRTPNRLINHIRTLVPVLRQRGIAYEFERAGRQRQRIHRLRNIDADGSADDADDKLSLSSAEPSALNLAQSRFSARNLTPAVDADDADGRFASVANDRDGPDTYSESVRTAVLPSAPSASSATAFSTHENAAPDADDSGIVSSAEPSASSADPDLVDLLAHRRDGHELVARLWQWACGRDFPSLEIAPGTRIIGCRSGWLAFLRTAESDKLEWAARAAGCE